MSRSGIVNKVLVLIFFVSCQSFQASTKTIISINQAGYLLNMNKFAWVTGLSNSGQKWYVKRIADKSIAYMSSISNIGSYDDACAETVLRLDFSALTEEGPFYIEIENEAKSFEFAISNSAYNDVFKASVKSYYFQRSGMALTSKYAGIWAKPASHTNDGYLYGGFANNQIIKGEYRKSTGGWYDAGDFGKKIVPASVALYPFLKLSQFYPEIVRSAKIEIPNSNPLLPDILAEAKWELDWFFTMQEKDGGVHHLIVTPEFYIGPAQFDPQSRYIVTVSTAATADFAATMALASKVYQPYLPSFADSCLVAAENAWKYLDKTPNIFPTGGYSDPQGINGTGAYGDTNDKDERLWASAELFAATKKEIYRKYFEDNYSGFYVYGPGSWNSVSNYAFYTWLEATSNETNNNISKTIKDAVIKWADNTVMSSGKNGFGVALNKNSYYWGSNSIPLNIGMEMLIINKLINSQKYTNTALEQLNYILGCNSLNFCFLSGFGTNGVIDPHQCINSYDNLTQAPPGFVPGGPNSYIDKWDLTLYNYVTQYKLPPAKCYIDKHESFSSNEVCVVYNSGLVMLSGFFYNNKITSELKDLTNQIKEKILTIFPNPAIEKLSVSVPESYLGAMVELYSISGKKTIEKKLVSIPQQIDISGLAEGEYNVVLLMNNLKVDSCKIIKTKL